MSTAVSFFTVQNKKQSMGEKIHDGNGSSKTYTRPLMSLPQWGKRRQGVGTEGGPLHI